MFVDRLQTFARHLDMIDLFYFPTVLELASCNLDMYNPVSCQEFGITFLALKINPDSTRKKLETVTFPTRRCPEDLDAAQ